MSHSARVLVGALLFVCGGFPLLLKFGVGGIETPWWHNILFFVPEDGGAGWYILGALATVLCVLIAAMGLRYMFTRRRVVKLEFGDAYLTYMKWERLNRSELRALIIDYRPTYGTIEYSDITDLDTKNIEGTGQYFVIVKTKTGNTVTLPAALSEQEKDEMTGFLAMGSDMTKRIKIK